MLNVLIYTISRDTFQTKMYRLLVFESTKICVGQYLDEVKNYR